MAYEAIHQNILHHVLASFGKLSCMQCPWWMFLHVMQLQQKQLGQRFKVFFKYKLFFLTRIRDEDIKI